MHDPVGIKPSSWWLCLQQQHGGPSSLPRAVDAVHDAVAQRQRSCVALHGAVAGTVAGAALLTQGRASGDRLGHIHSAARVATDSPFLWA